MITQKDIDYAATVERDADGFIIVQRDPVEHWPGVVYNDRDYPICPVCGTDVYFATQDATTLYWSCLHGHKHTTPNPHPWPLVQLSMFNQVAP